MRANVMKCFIMFCLLGCNFVLGSDKLHVWTSFIDLVKSGEYKPEMIRPHYETIREATYGFTTKMGSKIDWDKFQKLPEIIELENQLCFVIPITFDNDTRDYSFTFIQEENQWYLQHIEGLMIRLDKIQDLPQSDFPDINEDQKKWMHQEIYWSAQIRIFNHIYEEDSTSAFNWFKDGLGYFLAAKTWVPFVTPHKAFILYMCWDEKMMKGSEVTLEKLNDEEAVVIINPKYFWLYNCTSHYRQQISFAHYAKIFETMWHDRANTAGWNLEMEFNGAVGTFKFTII
ncbi:hypothetical protein KAR48_12620 [bacterium]|nr:hypothetical protein [bacterium]